MAETRELHEALAKLRKELQSIGTIMAVLADMIIVSEVWYEDSRLHVPAWLPDIDPEKGSLAYKRKHIVYDEKTGILKIRYAEKACQHRPAKCSKTRP